MESYFPVDSPPFVVPFPSFNKHFPMIVEDGGLDIDIEYAYNWRSDNYAYMWEDSYPANPKSAPTLDVTLHHSVSLAP